MQELSFSSAVKCQLVRFFQSVDYMYYYIASAVVHYFSLAQKKIRFGTLNL